MKKKNQSIGAMVKCLVEVDKWQVKQREMDKETSALIAEQKKVRQATRGGLKALKSMLKATALKGHRHTF